MSFGQSFQLTPVRLLSSISMILNGGTRITPHLGVELESSDGTAVKKLTYPAQENIISSQTSETMRMILEKVVSEGTGKNAYIEGYAIGGKTAVDLPDGKNLAGVIRQPLAVLIDPDSLKTLPPSALADGMAEAIKTGVLAGEELWPLVAAPEPDYEAILCGCAAYKAAIVSQEAQDTGIRLSLNLGHTIGHAVERHSGYTLSHGRAVAIGLASMARAGAALGWCDSITAERIKTALKRQGLPLRYRCRPEELLPYLWSDKKRQGEELTVVLPQQIGCCTLRKMTRPQLLQLLREGL